MKLISLNCERNKHLDLIVPFLHEEQPDVVCAQEVFRHDIPVIEAAFGAQAYFVPLLKILSENTYHVPPLGEEGIAIFVSKKLIQRDFHFQYYVQKNSEIPEFNGSNPNAINRAVAWITVEKDGATFVLADTHFTWTPDGSASDEQRANYVALENVLQTIPEFVLCGDFNAPRGGEIFTALAEKYADNIPSSVVTSIDPHIHRAGALQLMVDGMFSTPKYRVHDVRVVDGVSDHKAVVGEVELKNTTAQ